MLCGPESLFLVVGTESDSNGFRSVEFRSRSPPFNERSEGELLVKGGGPDSGPPGAELFSVHWNFGPEDGVREHGSLIVTRTLHFGVPDGGPLDFVVGDNAIPLVFDLPDPETVSP